jgi:hypothetical protein
MKKSLKKMGTVLMAGTIMTLSFGASADAASKSYASSEFGYGVYVGGGKGTSFTNVTDPYFKATHKAVSSGSASGVIYQIRYTGGDIYESNQQSGAISNKTVKVGSGNMGTKKAYLRNMYNESTKQTANGTFYY